MAFAVTRRGKGFTKEGRTGKVSFVLRVILDLNQRFSKTTVNVNSDVIWAHMPNSQFYNLESSKSRASFSEDLDRWQTQGFLKLKGR